MEDGYDKDNNNNDKFKDNHGHNDNKDDDVQPLNYDDFSDVSNGGI